MAKLIDAEFKKVRNVPGDSENVIYYLKCITNNCEEYLECEYVKQTKIKFKFHLAKHRKYPKSDIFKKKSSIQFTTRGHSSRHSPRKARSIDPFIMK